MVDLWTRRPDRGLTSGLTSGLTRRPDQAAGVRRL